MSNNEVKIEQITLRVPGMNNEDAHNLGQKVVHHIAQSLPSTVQNKRLDAINLKVNCAPGISHTAMVKAIAETILKGLVCNNSR